NTVHAGAGLGDNARLAHAPCQHDLSEHIVDLVCAGVIELLALEIDFRAAAMLGEPLGEIKRGWSADISREVAIHFLLKFWIGLGVVVRLLELADERHQRLGDEASAIEAKMAALIRAGPIRIESRVGHRAHEALTLVFSEGATSFAA